MDTHDRPNYDYVVVVVVVVVVVGGGTAGCVVASRLSEDPRLRVLLLEAGPADGPPAVDDPAAWVSLQGSVSGHTARGELRTSEPASRIPEVRDGDAVGLGG